MKLLLLKTAVSLLVFYITNNFVNGAPPTRAPTRVPTREPTYLADSPTPDPSRHPTKSPTRHPTYVAGRPTPKPTFVPSYSPTYLADSPTPDPSRHPTKSPTRHPTYVAGRPTPKPTFVPSRQPTQPTSYAPSSRPSSSRPSSRPSLRPTIPTSQPTSRPSIPTSQPTSRPSSPSSQPSLQPSGQPSRQPSLQPSRQPSRQPSSQPSRQPTSQPTHPTAKPSPQPTATIPIMSFTSNIALKGLTSSTLDDNSKVAIIKSAASSMNINSGAISIDQLKIYQASLMSSSIANLFNLPRLLTVTYSADVTLLTSLSLVSYPYSSPQQYYDTLTQQLTSSVSSGAFNNYLNVYAPINSAVYGAQATGVTNSGFTLAGVADNTVPQTKETLNIKAIAGAVVGVVVGLIILFCLIRKQYINFSCLKSRSSANYSNMNASNQINRNRHEENKDDDTVEIGYNRRNDWQDWSSNTKVETQDEGVSPFADNTKNTSNNFGKSKTAKKNPLITKSRTEEDDEDNFELQSYPPLHATQDEYKSQSSVDPINSFPESNSVLSISGKSFIHFESHQEKNVEQSNDIYNTFSSESVIQKSPDGWNTFDSPQPPTIHHNQFNDFNNTQVDQNWNSLEQSSGYATSLQSSGPSADTFNFQQNSQSSEHDMFSSFSHSPPVQTIQMNSPSEFFTQQSSQSSTVTFTSIQQQPVQPSEPVDIFTSLPQQPSESSTDIFTSIQQQSAVQPSGPVDKFNNNPFSSLSFTGTQQQQQSSQPQDLFHKFIQTSVELPKAQTQPKEKPINPFENIHSLIPQKKGKK